MGGIALAQVVTLRDLLLGQLPHYVDTLGLETDGGVDGDVLAAAVPCLDHHAMLLLQLLQVLRLVAEGVGGDPVSKADQTLGEVVTGEPCDDLLELHTRSAGDVDDEVPEVLPVPHHVH